MNNKKTTNEKTTNEKTTNEKTTNEKTTNEKTTNEKTTNEKTTNEKTTNLAKDLLISTSAASLAELITLPIDTIKVNLQSNVMQSKDAMRYPIKHSITQIYQHQGVRGFYRSWIAATSRQALSSGSRIGCYAYCREAFRWEKYPKLGAVLQGSLCGLLSNFLALPADVTKTKIQSSYTKITTSQAMKEIYTQNGGLLGFYRGFNQTAIRAITISSIQLPLYFGIQDYLTKQNISLNQRTTIASVLTTIGVSLTVYPIDLFKTQVQNHSDQTTKKLLKNIFIIHRNPFLLYKGLSVGIIRAIPHFWLTTTIYENLKSLT